METTPMTISPIALLAAFFLPLFPFSMVFNAALRAVRLVWLRAALLLIWPQIGVWLIAGAGMHLPQAWMSAVLAWATGSSLFYAWRMLSTRDFDIWIGFYASSAWALAWIGVVGGADPMGLHAAMACLSVTALALALASHCLRKRWGDAYVGLRPGLARAMPRLGTATTLSVLAALKTPKKPVFWGGGGGRGRGGAAAGGGGRGGGRRGGGAGARGW